NARFRRPYEGIVAAQTADRLHSVSTTPEEPAMTSHAHDAVMTALHDERLRVARNIHDLVMQDLTAVLLQLRAATSSSCNDSLSTCLGQATSAAEQRLQAARKLLRELRHEK